MKTYMAKPGQVASAWYVVDAAGIPVGRIATQVATLLRSKHRPEYTPHVDIGDSVVVINSDKMVLTGNKLEQKFHYTHSGYPGGLKSTKYSIMMEKKSDDVLKLAVKGMLAKNSIGRKQIKRLKVYKGDAHPHEAQKPVAIKLKGGAK